MSADFNWTSSEEAVVFPTVQAVAVYTNPNGDIVIRQEAGSTDDEDSFVVIPKTHAVSLVSAIQRELDRELPED